MDGQSDGAQSGGKILPIRVKSDRQSEENVSGIDAQQSSISSQSKKSKATNASSQSGQSKADQATGTSNDLSSSKPSGKPSSDAIPDFVLERNKVFEELKSKYAAEILERERPSINVVLDLGLDKNGQTRPAMPVAAKAWESTPGSFLRHLDKDITSDVVVAKINGKQLWDLDRPLEYDCRVSYVPFASAEGRNVFWHSSAHVLGEGSECHFQCLLSHGPPVQQGFFYDMAIPEGLAF